MATLISPGVSVTITDESFYASSGPGTVPLIIIATAQDKTDSAGTGIAPGTTRQNAGRLWLISSQRELLQTFGVPTFKTVGGTALHGYELNEYGLLAAHSYLGISNRAYVVRADVDTSQLEPSDTEPTANPADNTYWLNPTKVVSGLYESNGTDWVKANVFYATEFDAAGRPANVPSSYKYAMSVGQAAPNVENAIYRRNISGAWVLITANDNTVVYNKVYPVVGAVGNLWVNLRETSYALSRFDANVGSFVSVSTPLYKTSDDATDGFGTTLRQGSVFVQYNAKGTLSSAVNPAVTELQHKVKIHNGNTFTAVSVTLAATGPYSDTLVLGRYNGTSVTVNASGSSVEAFAQSLGQALVSNGVTDISVNYNTASRMVALVNDSGKDIIVTSSTMFSAGIYSNWVPLEYSSAVKQPSGQLDNGTLWYSTDYKVDILVNDGVGAWTNLAGSLFVQSAEPTTNVADGDVWVSTSSAGNYPVIYRRVNNQWRLVDNTDQTTPNGVIFADARPVNSGALDADAPDALAYPQGILLFNTRYSTRNVKQWQNNYTFEGNVIGDRWVSVSGLRSDGSLYTGGEAVKQVVVRSIASTIQANEDIRSENVFYNLIAAPGYPELIDELVALNVDRKQTAFVIGDSPFTLSATGTNLQEWSSNSKLATENGSDGLVTADPYLGVYYPSGLSTDLNGNNVVVPPSHMLLRTIAYNDQVAYPWFAPAGYQRGIVSNATSVGYINSEGEFVAVSLNEGQRDTLYTNNVNPISQVPNRGIVVWGQKSRNPVTSSLDRVNVARLVNYVRYQLDLLLKPFVFEPNDSRTRQAVQVAVEAFLSEIVTLRGITDFVVDCSDSNNTPDRIDRNELWVDVAIVPTRAVEFIYVPIRLQNTGS